MRRNVLNKMKNIRIPIGKGGRGQSFVELAIVFMFLLTMLTGVVEFGNLLNQYINVIDGAREGARAASNASPFQQGTDIADPSFYTNIDDIIEGTFNADGSEKDKSAIEPVRLDPAADDVVISVFAIDKDGTLKRFPQGTGYWSRYGNHTSQFADTDVTSLISGTKNLAPNTGMVLVEVFYAYHTILQMPFLPTVIPLHTYAVMPLTAAEATPTPCPGSSCP